MGRNQRLGALEIDYAHVGTIADQDIAIAALQRGARDDAVRA
jgi:hypothetical protein